MLRSLSIKFYYCEYWYRGNLPEQLEYQYRDQPLTIPRSISHQNRFFSNWCTKSQNQFAQPVYQLNYGNVANQLRDDNRKLTMMIDLAQCIGFIALFLGASAFWNPNGEQFKRRLTWFQLTIMLHFILLGSLASAAVTLIAALRSYFSTKTHSLRVAIFFIIIIWIIGLTTMKYQHEILTMIGASIGTYALYRCEGIQMRLLILVNSTCWFTNNLLIGSIGGTLTEGLFIALNLKVIATMYNSYRRNPMVEMSDNNKG